MADGKDGGREYLGGSGDALDFDFAAVDGDPLALADMRLDQLRRQVAASLLAPRPSHPPVETLRVVRDQRAEDRAAPKPDIATATGADLDAIVFAAEAFPMSFAERVAARMNADSAFMGTARAVNATTVQIAGQIAGTSGAAPPAEKRWGVWCDNGKNCGMWMPFDLGLRQSASHEEAATLLGRTRGLASPGETLSVREFVDHKTPGAEYMSPEQSPRCMAALGVAIPDAICGLPLGHGGDVHVDSPGTAAAIAWAVAASPRPATPPATSDRAAFFARFGIAPPDAGACVDFAEMNRRFDAVVLEASRGAAQPALDVDTLARALFVLDREVMATIVRVLGDGWLSRDEAWQRAWDTNEPEAREKAWLTAADALTLVDLMSRGVAPQPTGLASSAGDTAVVVRALSRSMVTTKSERCAAAGHTPPSDGGHCACGARFVGR